MAITGIGLVVCCTDLGPEYVDKMAPVGAFGQSHSSSVGGEGTIPCNELLCWNALGLTGNWCKEEQPRWQELRGACRGCGVAPAPVLLS